VDEEGGQESSLQQPLPRGHLTWCVLFEASLPFTFLVDVLVCLVHEALPCGAQAVSKLTSQALCKTGHDISARAAGLLSACGSQQRELDDSWWSAESARRAAEVCPVHCQTARLLQKCALLGAKPRAPQGRQGRAKPRLPELRRGAPPCSASARPACVPLGLSRHLSAAFAEWPRPARRPGAPRLRLLHHRPEGRPRLGCAACVLATFRRSPAACKAALTQPAHADLDKLLPSIDILITTPFHPVRAAGPAACSVPAARLACVHDNQGEQPHLVLSDMPYKTATKDAKVAG